MFRFCAAVSLLAFASPALAEETREFCADRPGLGTPACTLAPGTAMLEIGAAAWDHSRNAATVEDEVTLGDALLRLGVTETTEVQFGLTGHVVQRSRDRATGLLDRASGLGDGTIAIRQGLAGPNGKVALQAYVTVPLAKPPIGSGEWSGGLLLPFGFDLPSGFTFDVTPEIDLAANEVGGGHHLAWGGVAGLTHDLVDTVSLTGEIGVLHDDDPSEPSTDARLALSLAWQPAERFQIDFEADAGLSDGAPDRVLAIGLAWQFR